MPNIRLLRDIKARNVVKTSEVLRRAYLYVARNETLPAQVRHQAQLQLNSFSKYARPTTVKNRCYESGRGRGIISEFALSRVCLLQVDQYSSVDLSTVSLPIGGTTQRACWCEEGIMVKADVLYVSMYMTTLIAIDAGLP